MTHTQEIQNLINTALHAPATGSIVIQGALFLDIISRLEVAEKQNAELKEQSSRLANESVRQAQQNADLCVKNAELLDALIWISVESESTAMVISRTRISMAAKEAIAKAGK